jgi:hypothetical protein
MEERFQTELRCWRRAKGESIRELAQDICRLITLAYPGEKSRLAEHIARDAFLTALDDPELELKVREKEPHDLDTAVKMSQRFEMFRNTTESRASVRPRSNRHVLEDTCNDDRTDLEVRVTSLEERLQVTEEQQI